MTFRPIRGHHKYVTVAQIAEARDRAIEELRKHVQAFDPGTGGGVEELVVALTTYKVDYREIADGVGISGLDVLRVLAEDGLENDEVAQVYRAGLVTERDAVEAYRASLIEEQRAEVLNLLDADQPLAAVARDVGVTRATARAWYEAARSGVRVDPADDESAQEG